jgi:hypothetical protein
MLPNLVIAGVPKAGTTSLFRYLASHPDIGAASVKEAQYFRPLLTGDRPRPIEEYHALFQGCSGQRYVCEATPEYFYGGAAVVEAMCDTLGSPKVILILREPISRLASFFHFHKAHLRLDPKLSLRDYVSSCLALTAEERLVRHNSHLFGLHGGLYSDYLPAWIDRLGASLRILFFDDLQRDRMSMLTELAGWLGIDPKGFDPQVGVENPSHEYRWAMLQRLALSVAEHAEGFSRRSPRAYGAIRDIYLRLNGRRFADEPDGELKAILEAFYAPYNQQLGSILLSSGYEDLPGWARPAAIRPEHASAPRPVAPRP